MPMRTVSTLVFIDVNGNFLKQTTLNDPIHTIHSNHSLILTYELNNLFDFLTSKTTGDGAIKIDYLDLAKL